MARKEPFSTPLRTSVGVRPKKSDQVGKLALKVWGESEGAREHCRGGARGIIVGSDREET